MASLSRSEILSIPKPPPRLVNVPQWPGDVFIRIMDGRQREKFEKVYTANDRNDIRATLLAFTLSDSTGALLFTEADIPALNGLAAPALMRLYDIALEENKVTDDQIAELEKN